MKTKKMKQAHGFELKTCEDPTCGAHFIATDCDDNPICEIIVPKESILSLIEALHGLLYQKAVEEDGD